MNNTRCTTSSIKNAGTVGYSRVVARFNFFVT